MRTELDTPRTGTDLPVESPRTSSQTTPRRLAASLHNPLSQAAIQTSAPSISNLMRIALENPGVVSLAAGFVDQQSLPIEAASRAITSLFSHPVDGRKSLQYGTTIGHQGLRETLITRLEAAEGVAPGSYRDAVARTVVTTGSAQLIYLLCEALLDPGDIVLVESPTYFVFLGPVETRGARSIRVPIDEHGLQIDALEQAFEKLNAEGLLKRVKMVYTIPEHANPTGISMAADRRKPLVELVQRWSEQAGHRIYLLEDAAYHGLSFDEKEPHSLWSQDPEGETVILARTFSKTFSPGLKLGYGVLPKGLIEPILRLKGNHDFGSSNFNQQIVEQALVSGDYDRHVAGLKALYTRKRDIFLKALDENLSSFGSEVHWTHPKGGLFSWMTIPEGIDTGFDGPLFPRCVEHGVIYVPGEYAFAPEPSAVPKNHLRLTFGLPSESDLVEGSRRLALALNAVMG